MRNGSDNEKTRDRKKELQVNNHGKPRWRFPIVHFYQMNIMKSLKNLLAIVTLLMSVDLAAQLRSNAASK